MGGSLTRETVDLAGVFDGSAAMQKFRAAVRDRLGNDAVGQAQFAVGKLEVR